jgi:apolipoprotein D and lipocalin family protein
MRTLLVGIISLIMSGCMGMPRLVTPVKEFELEKYLGTWYEIARLDHSFERGLSQVSAVYSLRDDGGVSVRNSGYSAGTDEWKGVEGKAYFVNSEDEGYLRVSFFGPFYSSYVIFGLDQENYTYAFVSGYNTSYLWLLSRAPTVDEKIITKFIQSAHDSGFDTDQLIFVEQDRNTKAYRASSSAQQQP